MHWKEERQIHIKPPGFKLEKDDVFGKFDDNHKRIDNGLLVAQGYADVDAEYFPQEKYDELRANLPDICPVWNDKLPDKSVTIICSSEQSDEAMYWLSYVHGGGFSMMIKLSGDRVAIRSNYQCW
jgi:hypothetical protein